MLDKLKGWKKVCFIVGLVAIMCGVSVLRTYLEEKEKIDNAVKETERFKKAIEGR